MDTEDNGNTAKLPETSGNPAEPTGNAEASAEIKRTGLDFYTWAIRNEGAFSAFLALSHALEGVYVAHSKKQYVTFVNSLIEMLLTDYHARDVFLSYQGECDIVVDTTTCEVKEMHPPHGWRASK